MMPEMRINKMLYGGAGAAASGTAIPFVLPGELVEIGASKEVKIIEASPHRATPACVHYVVCGGCHYQHAIYPAQLRMKEEILRDTFAAAGLADLPKIEVHSGPEWHYRNRIRLRVGEIDGQLRVGYNRHNAAGGDPLLPIAMCPIAAPILWHAASTLLELAKSHEAVKIWMTAAAELEFFTNANETVLQVILFSRNAPTAGFDNFCTLLQQAVPQLSGVSVGVMPKVPSHRGRRSESVKTGAQWGSPGLSYTVETDGHWVSRGAFFQVNRYLVSTLMRLATADRSGRLAWDLYAGVGLFSQALANSFEQVVAVEAGEPAATDLAAALKGKKHHAFGATTLEFLQAAVVQRERPDLIVMDPPRAGTGSEVCGLLARIRAPELVYVSCDPVTLARDLKQLTGDGYKLSALHLVDMFPQTFHMETVAILRR